MTKAALSINIPLTQDQGPSGIVRDLAALVRTLAAPFTDMRDAPTLTDRDVYGAYLLSEAIIAGLDQVAEVLESMADDHRAAEQAAYARGFTEGGNAAWNKIERLNDKLNRPQGDQDETRFYPRLDPTGNSGATAKSGRD